MTLTLLVAMPIHQLLSELKAGYVECVDVSSESCTGAKLELIIVSKQFDGLQLLHRHRLVHAAVEEYKNQIHALTIKAWTPDQYEEQSNRIKS